MKIAIAHDYLNQYGGAERVVETIHELFPEATIFTSIYIKSNMPESFKHMSIKTSFMQKLPFLKKHFKKYLLFYPKAMQNFNLSNYDIVISSSSAFAKGIITGKKTCHICYCYSPMRFVWDYEKYINKEDINKVILKILPKLIKKLKYWDLETNKRVDYFIAISKDIKNRIKRFYNREATVIYPPVEIEKFRVLNSIGDYFLIVSRLNSYKNIDLVIKAFNKLRLNIKIVGTGPYKQELEKMSKGNNIEFLGRVSDDRLVELYGSCRAFIFPGEEDFGIAPLEAQASGRPVIAYAKRGALETVVENTTGVFFKENSVISFSNTIKKFMKMEDIFNPKIIREHALKFDKRIFKIELEKYIFKRYKEFKN